MEIIEGSCGYWARGVSIRGTFVLSRNMGYKMGRGGHHVAKRSSDPRLAEVKVQGRDLVRIVGFITRFALLEAGTRGKFVLSSFRGNGPRKRVQGAPSRGTLRESQANFRVGTVWGL